MAQAAAMLLSAWRLGATCCRRCPAAPSTAAPRPLPPSNCWVGLLLPASAAVNARRAAHMDSVSLRQATSEQRWFKQSKCQRPTPRRPSCAARPYLAAKLSGESNQTCEIGRLMGCWGRNGSTQAAQAVGSTSRSSRGQPIGAHERWWAATASRPPTPAASLHQLATGRLKSLNQQREQDTHRPLTNRPPGTAGCWAGHSPSGNQ